MKFPQIIAEFTFPDWASKETIIPESTSPEPAEPSCSFPVLLIYNFPSDVQLIDVSDLSTMLTLYLFANSAVISNLFAEISSDDLPVSFANSPMCGVKIICEEFFLSFNISA